MNPILNHLQQLVQARHGLNGGAVGANNADDFAQMRLAQLAKMGFTPKSLGITGQNPAEIWRALSPIMGAIQASRAGKASQYAAPTDMHPAVQALLQKILEQQPQASGQQAPTQVARPGAPAYY